MRKLSLLTTIIFSLLATQVVTAANPAFKVEPVASGLGVPWGMTFVDEGTLLVTIRSGSVNLVDINSGKITPVSGLPAIQAANQGGLLDVAKSAENQRYGFTYSKPGSNGPATTWPLPYFKARS